jgi:hypothetical protein
MVIFLGRELKQQNRCVAAKTSPRPWNLKRKQRKCYVSPAPLGPVLNPSWRNGDKKAVTVLASSWEPSSSMPMNPTADGFRQYHDALPANLAPSPRHPQGAGSGRFEPTTFDYIMTKRLGSPRADLIDVPEEASDQRPVALGIGLSSR